MTLPDDLLILHHHDPSPFAEKIRLAFGIKGLRWASVRVPMIMPKPDLLALTGGYRGTPVLQIGADIYCDTRLIVEEIERRFPQPPLLRSGPLVNLGLQHWSDEVMFPPGAALAMHENAAALPEPLLADRRDYFTNLDFARFAEDADHFRAQLAAHAALIERQLADGRAYLLGDAPEWADINAYFLLWMLGAHVASGPVILAGKPRLERWGARLAAHGAGERREVSAAEAIDLARAAAAPPATQGDAVRVFPVAHPDTAVTGALVRDDDQEIVVARIDARAGLLRIHFPRIGYRIVASGR